MRFFCEERRLQEYVGVDHMVRHNAYDRIVPVIEGPKTVVYRQRVLLRYRAKQVTPGDDIVKHKQLYPNWPSEKDRESSGPAQRRQMHRHQ